MNIPHGYRKACPEGFPHPTLEFKSQLVSLTGVCYVKCRSLMPKWCVGFVQQNHTQCQEQGVVRTKEQAASQLC